MKGFGASVLCLVASSSGIMARLSAPMPEVETHRTLFNRSLSGENRTLYEEYNDYERSLFNRSLEYDNFNRSLFNRSLESRRLLEEPNEEVMYIRGGVYNRTLQANRTLEADFLGGYNRSLEYEYYNRSLYNRTL